MRDINPNQIANLLARGMAVWPLGTGTVMSARGLHPETKAGMFIMVGVPDNKTVEDWKAHVPTEDDFRELANGDGPVCIIAFKHPTDVTSVIESLQALRDDMIRAGNDG